MLQVSKRRCKSTSHNLPVHCTKNSLSRSYELAISPAQVAASIQIIYYKIQIYNNKFFHCCRSASVAVNQLRTIFRAPHEEFAKQALRIILFSPCTARSIR